MTSRNLTITLSIFAALSSLVVVKYEDAREVQRTTAQAINPNPESDAHWTIAESQKRQKAADQATEECMHQFGVTKSATTIRSEVQKLQDDIKSWGTLPDDEYRNMTNGQNCLVYGEEAGETKFSVDWGARKDELSRRIIMESRQVFWRRFFSLTS